MFKFIAVLISVGLFGCSSLGTKHDRTAGERQIASEGKAYCSDYHYSDAIACAGSSPGYCSDYHYS